MTQTWSTTAKTLDPRIQMENNGQNTHFFPNERNVEASYQRLSFLAMTRWDSALSSEKSSLSSCNVLSLWKSGQKPFSLFTIVVRDEINEIAPPISVFGNTITDSPMTAPGQSHQLYLFRNGKTRDRSLSLLFQTDTTLKIRSGEFSLFSPFCNRQQPDPESLDS